MSADLREIKELLEQVPKPPGEVPPPGLSDRDLIDAERSLGMTLPAPLRQWLKVTNGPCVGPGGLFGFKTARASLDIEKVLALYPEWRAEGWIPIAGDGCGNFYVLASKEGDEDPPVFFVDAHEEPTKPAFVVASGLISFIRFLLKKELGESSWPFREQEVLDTDPAIMKFRNIGLPWEGE